MTIRISVRGDIKAVLKDLDRIHRKHVPAAAKSALNKAVSKVRSESAKEIARQRYITPARLVRDRIKLTKATGRLLSAWIHALVLPIPAIKMLKVRDITKRRGLLSLGTGVSVGRHRFPGAFIAQMPSGLVGIFKRKGKLRFPIKQQSIELEPDATRILEKHINTTGRLMWATEFQKQLNARINRARAGGG